MQCRRLSRAELGHLTDIDWTETIENIYYMRDGALVLEREHWEAPDWSPARKQEQIAALQDDYDKGATIFGAFDGPALVGMSVLQHRPLKTGDARLNLAGLWVSRRSRRSGVGRALCGLAAEEARTRGAEFLYASATPSENTVRFYLTLGFRLADPVDPELLEKEPEDIHLELVLE